VSTYVPWFTQSAPPSASRSIPDGTYLSRLKAPRALARAGAADITVRVVEYHLTDEEGTVTETFALITNLLDPAAAPARELAELYHERWQIETALGAFKSQLKGNGVVLRSKTPDGAEQERWALLCAYHAIRDPDLRRRRPCRTRTLTHLLRQRARRGARPGRRPGRFPPLAERSMTCCERACSSSPQPPTRSVEAVPIPAKPSGVSATPPSPPTRPDGLNAGDL